MVCGHCPPYWRDQTGVQTKRVDMAYNAVNQLTSLSRFSGVNPVVDTNYVYDNNQRLIQLSHKKGASTVASYDYSYDAADKLARTISSVDGTSNYSYDATNQLTGTDHSSQTDEAYSYDVNGNRTSGGTVTGVNNQLLSDGTYSYQYDGEGNRTKRTERATGKITEYIWDYRNRLAGVLFKDAGGSVTKTIDYIYDGNNQRIGKRIDGAVTERYVIDRNQIALVFDGAGTQTHRYLYGTAVDQVLADETATSMVWALADNQGTVKDLIDNTGVVVNHVTYDSFGKVVAQSNAGVEFRYGYTGREQDAETGLDYYRARYYDASNGRFISEDPLGFDAGDSNLSRYVGNSPVNGTDPSGQRDVKPLEAKYGIYDALKRLQIQETPPERLKQPPTRPNSPKTSPSPQPKVTPPPNPNFCKLEDKNKTCENHEEFYKYSPLPKGLKFEAFKDTDLLSTIGVMKGSRRRTFGNDEYLYQGKTELMLRNKKRYKDPNNIATHYNINIVNGNGALGGSIGKYEFCIENGNSPYIEERYGILNIKSTPNSNSKQRVIGSDP